MLHTLFVFVVARQSFAWSSSGQLSVPSRLPFVVDVCEASVRQLEQLLAEVADGLEQPADWPPTQERECMTVAALNLLNLQACCSRAACHVYLETIAVRSQLSLNFK